MRRVECPAAARLLERWKALATPREDDGYEDVASAEAGARAEERARRHLDDYLGRAPIPGAGASTTEAVAAAAGGRRDEQARAHATFFTNV